MPRKKKRSAFAAWLAALASAALAVACCPCRDLATATTDSVRVEKVVWTEYVTDTLFFPLVAESVSAVRPDSSRLETEYAVSEACLTSDGLLFHTLWNKAVEVPLGYEKPVVHVDSTTDRVITHTRVVEVPRELTGWQRFQMGGFWALAALFAMIIALCLIRILK